MKTQSFSKTNNHYPKCESTSISSASRCFSVWQPWLHLVRTKVRSLSQAYVTLGLQTGLIVLRQCLRQLFQNRRHFIGVVLLGLGVVGYFAHYLLADPHDFSSHDICPYLGFQPGQCWDGKASGWCFVSAYYYWDVVNLFVAIVFWSVAGFLLVPYQYSGWSFVIFSLTFAFGLTMFLHRSFDTTSHFTYHSFPHWSFVVLALAFGFGIMLCIKPVMYWWNHKALGNWTKFVGVTEMKGYTPDQKDPIYQQLAKDFRQVQKLI